MGFLGIVLNSSWSVCKNKQSEPLPHCMCYSHCCNGAHNSTIKPHYINGVCRSLGALFSVVLFESINQLKLVHVLLYDIFVHYFGMISP